MFDILILDLPLNQKSSQLDTLKKSFFEILCSFFKTWDKLPEIGLKTVVNIPKNEIDFSYIDR